MINESPVPASTYTPAPSPTDTPVPLTPTPESPTESGYQLIISSRPRVGRPNYDLHPTFVQPGSFARFVDTSKLT